MEESNHYADTNGFVANSEKARDSYELESRDSGKCPTGN